jgi:CRISPR/Cas system-associated exonuclease Cas4 (RecB family)
MIDSTNVGEALLNTLYQQRSLPRGDELLTHTTDIVECLRAVSYRRRGMTPAPFTRRDMAKFAMGHAFEHETARTLRKAGHDIQEGVEVAAFGLDIGHPDIIVDRELLLETKTTDGYPTYPKSDKARAGQPKEVSTHHALQASAYALALELPRAIVFVKYADFDHTEVPYEVNPEDYREIIEERARAVVALTGPEMPIPPAEPPPSDVVEYDVCSYCRFPQCEKNPKHTPGFEEE